jgi:hypothetical protein
MGLWRCVAQPDGRRRWARHELPDGGLALAVDATGALALGDAPREGALVACLVPLQLRGARETALVVAPEAPAILVDGFPPLGIELVGDRAELRIAGETLYLGACAPARPTRLDSAPDGARCARCLRELATGDMVLRCPGCDAWHHDGERAGGAGELRCAASYDLLCAGCRLPWSAVAWSPEEEEPR